MCISVINLCIPLVSLQKIQQLFCGMNFALMNQMF